MDKDFKRFTWEEQLARGTIFEKAMERYFVETNPDRLYFPVSNKKIFQDMDIDLLEMSKSAINNDIVTIEIKCDETDYKTENLFIESISCKAQGTQGWLYKTQADYICYAFTKKGKYFMIPRGWLLELISVYEFRSGEAHDKYKTSVGYLVPSSMLKDFEIKDEKLDKIFKETYAALNNK